MKKLFVVLVCISILFSGCGNNTPQPIPSEIELNSESEIEIPKLENPDFRNSNWGDSIEKVKKSELILPIGEVSDSLVYKSKILNLSCAILYNFDNNQLISGGYVFDEKHSSDNLYYEDYLKLVKAYTEKYGEPISSEEVWNRSLYKDNPEKIGFAISIGDVVFKTKWITNTSTIGILIKGDNYNFSTGIVYQALDYEPQENTNGI